MIGKGVGVLALAVVLGFVSYYETSLLQSQRLSAIAPDSRAFLAQAPTATGSGARTECKGGETLTVTIGADGVTSAGACNLPKTNTCKVIVISPDKPPGVVTKCCHPEDGKCDYCLDQAVSCDMVYPMKGAVAQVLSPYKYKCTQSSQKSSAVKVESQVAQAGGASAKSEPQPINCNELKNRLNASSRPTVGVQPSVTEARSGLGTNAPTEQLSARETARAPARPVETAFKQDTAAPGQQLPPQQQTPNSFSQIRAELGKTEGTGLGQPGQTTFPGQTATQPTGPAFEQGGFYRPRYSNPSGELSGSTRSGFFSPLFRAQNTFGDTGFSGSRGGSRVAASFISGFASLIGGLFSVPTNSVVNYVQSFVGGSSQQTPADESRTQQPTYAPGQVIVVVPYPMPTSRKGDTLGTLPPPPTPANDAYAELRELARQANGTIGAQASTGAQDNRVTSAFTGQDDQTQTGPGRAGNANASNRDGVTPLGRENGISRGGEQLGTGSTPVAEGEATSTHATSTSYKEPKVVEVGIPVDITDLGSYESVLAYLRGDWARTERTALQNKIALAQAEVQQEAIRAQIEALQDARAADLCDDSCAASLTVLQNELPVLQSRVEALQTAIEKDAAPHPASPPPTVAQIHRVVESLADPNYKATVPRSAAGAPTAVSVYEQEALPEVPQSKSEAVVTRVVQSVWNFLKSIFLPPTATSTKPRASCSLFASLFGKCK